MSPEWRALYKQGEGSFDPWPELDEFRGIGPKGGVMKEYVTNVELYVWAETEEEARELTHALLENVFSRSEVSRLDASRPEPSGEWTVEDGFYPKSGERGDVLS